jgi:hypothetical protein
MTARFIRQGVSEFKFSPTIANVNAVTRSEYDSAEDLTEFIAGVNGWMLGNNDVPTPDFGSDFDGSIPGTNSVDNSSFDFYEDLDAETIEELLPALTPGFVLIARKGDKPASNSLDCFPVRVRAKGNSIELGNTPAKFNVAFSITGKPGLDGPVPAAATP